jgi:hypothetical protein
VAASSAIVAITYIVIGLRKKRQSSDDRDVVEPADADGGGNGSGSTSARTRAGGARIAAPPVPKAMAPSAVRVMPASSAQKMTLR